jgi:hypothetical protein
MDGLYFTKELGGNRKLCIAPLSNRRLANADCEIDDVSGYFLYEQEGSGEFAPIKLIAQLLSDDAALDLRDLFGMT